MAQRLILNETSYHGAGAVKEIVPEVKRRGLKKALIVTDQDLMKFGVVKQVTDILDAAELPYSIYDEVVANPTVAVVKKGVDVFQASGADYLIAVGGGSPMDAAKAVGIIVTNPEFADVVSLEGVTPSKNPSVPLIAIATTAGTASETTIYYVITDEAKCRKYVCVDPHDIPIVAIVDPEIMSGMPPGLTAATGMDALTHCIEAYVTRAAWEMSDFISLKAIEMISNSLRNTMKNDPDARREMALAQYMAGMAFSNVGLGLVHSMAHPLSAHYDTPHGVANAVLLPYVMEFNAPAAATKYRDVARAMGVTGTEKMSDAEGARAAIDAVRKLSKDLDIPQTLGEIGVQEKDLKTLAASAIVDICTGGNPRDCTVEEVLGVYRTALG